MTTAAVPSPVVLAADDSAAVDGRAWLQALKVLQHELFGIPADAPLDPARIMTAAHWTTETTR